MRTTLAVAVAAAALFTAAPTFAQGFGVQVGPFGFGVGPDYSYGPPYDYDYGPGYPYTYRAPLYEGRSVGIGRGGVAYCERHFKSYNRSTGMYLGYDGEYHHCP